MRVNQLVTIHGVSGAEQWTSGQTHAVAGQILDFGYALCRTTPEIKVSQEMAQKFEGYNNQEVTVWQPTVSIRMPQSLPQPARLAESDVYVITNVTVAAAAH